MSINFKSRCKYAVYGKWSRILVCHGRSFRFTHWNKRGRRFANQWWPSLQTHIYASLGLGELNCQKNHTMAIHEFVIHDDVIEWKYFLRYSGRWPPSKIDDAPNSGSPKRDFRQFWVITLRITQIWGFTQIWAIPRSFAQIWVIGQPLGIVFICFLGKGSQCKIKSHLLIGPVLCAWWSIPTASSPLSVLNNFKRWSPRTLESVIHRIFWLWFARRE